MKNIDFDSYLYKQLNAYTDQDDYEEKLEEMEAIVIELEEIYNDCPSKENEMNLTDYIKELNDFKNKDDDEENYY